MQDAGISGKSFSARPVAFSLLALWCIYLINHCFGFFGHYGYDDMYYAALAHQVLTHTFSLGSDHYNYRWVTIFLTALAYSVFGINDHASALMPLLFTLLTAWLVAKSISNKWEAALAVLLFGLSPWTLFYADKIMPDVYVAFFFFLAIYILYKQKVEPGNYRLYGFMFSLSLLLGFLSKETIILTVPVFLYLVIADLLQKRNLKFWLAATLSGIGLLVFYFLIIEIETGSFLQRFQALRNGSYFNPCSYDLLPISETIRRVAYGLWLVFIRSGLFFLLLLTIPAITDRRLKSLLKTESSDDFYIMVLTLALLSANFMSTSVFHYVPMCDDPRHYLFLVPVAAVLASKGTFLFFNNPKTYYWLPVLFFLTFLLARHEHFENPYLTYLPLSIIALIALASSFARMRFLFAGVAAVVAVSLAQPVQAFLYARQMGYRFQKRVVVKNIAGQKDNILVITNTVEANLGNYYLGFDTSKIIFKSFDEMKNKALPPNQKVYLLLDGFSNTMSGKSWDDLPAYAKQTGTYKLLDRQGGVELFQLQPLPAQNL